SRWSSTVQRLLRGELPKQPRKIVQSLRALLSGLHVAHNRLPVFELGVSDDHGIANTRPIRAIELALQLSITVRQLSRHARLAQCPRDRHQPTEGSLTQRNQEGQWRQRSVRLPKQQDHSLQPNGEPDPGVGRPTELLDESIIAAAARNRVLR